MSPVVTPLTALFLCIFALLESTPQGPLCGSRMITLLLPAFCLVPVLLTFSQVRRAAR
jgi:hypothetical protein